MNEEKVKILIVEDEVIIAMRLEMFFERRGYEVTATVSSGEEAVESALAKNPDVILMDIHLKTDMSGIEAGELIHEQKKIPIIFVTGYSDAVLKEKAMRLSPLGYFLKPVNVYEIITALNELIL